MQALTEGDQVRFMSGQMPQSGEVVRGFRHIIVVEDMAGNLRVLGRSEAVLDRARMVMLNHQDQGTGS
jgi:hypothetical protein